MELQTIEELLISILPAGTASIVAVIIAIIVKYFLNKVVEIVSKLLDRMTAMEKHQDELETENIQLKRKLNAVLDEFHNVKTVGDQDGKEESI